MLKTIKAKVGRVVTAAAEWFGSLSAVLLAALSLILYVVLGFFFGFSPAYQLVANVCMSSAAYLIMFIIQYTQNIDSRATHLKLDDLIAIHKKGDNELINIEKLDEDELKELEKKIRQHLQDED